MNTRLYLSPLLMHVFGSIYAFLGILDTMYVLYTYIVSGIPRRHEIIRNMLQQLYMFKYFAVSASLSFALSTVHSIVILYCVVEHALRRY